MADMVTKQELANAKIDAKDLGEALNLKKTITPRYGDNFKSLPLAIEDLLKHGSRAYPTLALANADIANIALNTKVSVLSANEGGDYYKATAGATSLTKSPYDPIAQAKQKVRDLENSIIANKAEQIFDGIDFIPRPKMVVTTVSPSGINTQDLSYKRAPTPTPVKQGDVVTVNAVIPDNNTPYLQMWRADSTVPFGIAVQEIGSPKLQTWTYTVPADGLLYVQTKVGSVGASFSINKGGLRFAQEVKDRIFSDFEMGYVDSSGSKIPSVKFARSKVYHINEESTIFFERYNENVYFGFATSIDENVPKTIDTYDWYDARSFSRVTRKGHKFIRFYLKDKNDANLDLSTMLSQFRIKTKARVLYDYEMSPLAGAESTSHLPIAQDFSSTFRSPSLAVGGVVSFIDDDSRSWVHSDLYPFMKTNNAPFGMAVIQGRLGRDTYLTQEQLVELIQDKEIVEAMNHTVDHFDLTSSSLTNEQREAQIYNTKRFLNNLGAEASGFVLPFGSDGPITRRIIQKYHKACYDFGGDERVETFDTIKNELIRRSTWGLQTDRIQYHKNLVDQAVATNGWLIIATHVRHELYWDARSFNDLQIVIDYIKSKGVRILRPDEAFQIFGNIVENDSGFRIQANGKIVGAT